MKKKASAFIISLTIALTMLSCNPQKGQVTPTATKMSEFTHTPGITPGADPTKTPTSIPLPTNTQEDGSFPLAERGAYFTGTRAYTLVDNSRNGRKIEIKIYYPALKAVNAEGETITFEAAPDMSEAPYPVILTGYNSGNYLFKSQLASHGFVMVIVKSPGFSYTAPWNHSVLDAPLDFLFVLDWLGINPPAELEGVLDTNRTGVAGYSSDGLFSLALGGARINPEYYLSQCARASTMEPGISPFLIDYYCNLSKRWDEFSAQAPADVTRVSEGMWQPTTDDRILAVMPMAPDSAWLYGPEGLAAINIPSLIIAGTADDLVSYRLTSCYIYEHLVNSDTSLISFIGKQHMMVEESEVIKRINHFAAAFFGYYLQGHTAYTVYFSEDFVSQFDDLYWGVYPE